MRIGFGKVDITPRVGVEMSGFGPYRHRVARDVRDRLYARAMAASDGRGRWVLVSGDLIAVNAAVVAEARSLIAKATGLAARQIMLHATHTHSGPATAYPFGWGEKDGPYIERLASLITRAAVEAVGNLAEAEVLYAAAPVEHIAYNRSLESRPKYEAALKENWLPRFPEQTDRLAHVLCVRRRGRMIGFLSSFSCHPVVCCEDTYSLHGDYAGVATNTVETENTGCVGMFLQGGHGDINTAVCHEPQERSMRALKVLAGRYARTIRQGLALAKPIKPSPVKSALDRVVFRRARLTVPQMEKQIASYRKKVLDLTHSDQEEDLRMNMVHLAGLRAILAHFVRTGTHETPLDMQALRLGEVTIVGTPFELYRGIKERLLREARCSPLLMLSMTNDAAGYAPTRERFKKDSYSASMVPHIVGTCPFTASLESEIVAASLRLIERLE